MRLTLIAIAAASVAASVIPAQAEDGDTPLRTLIVQGQYWQAHRRGDLAEQAWQKVLRIDPNQVDALYGMGMARADANDGAGAQKYLAQLRQVAPNDSRIDTLSERLGETSPRTNSLNTARMYAQSGQSASAVAAYQQALGGKPATPELQLEYNQALAATPQGWDQARRGLEQLAHDHPDDPRYALALAQHLSYRDATRRDAIARLARLANDPTYGVDARKSWRQALLWLGARPSDAALYEAYLSTAPDDAAVKARYDGMVRQDQAARASAQIDAARSIEGKLVADGFAALDNSDLATASADFKQALANLPNNPDALGGLGIVALKQERFAEARDYLERASRTGNAQHWQQALTSARYWTDTSAAIGARSNGDNAKAKQLLEQAIEIDPSDVTAQVLLGETLLDAHDATGAETAYRMALRRQADNPDAIRGLVGALAAQGRGGEALQFAEALTAEQQAKVGGLDSLRASALMAQGRAAEAQGDLGSARSLFEDALIGRPDDPWLRLDLAHIYVRQGALGSARSIMDGLIAAHPDMPDALYAGALLAADTQDWQDGLQLLERIPAAQRSTTMIDLQHRLWVHQQAGYALQLVRAGQFKQAYAILFAAQPVAGNSPELVGALADVYVQAGDPYRALNLMRAAMASAPDDAGTLLQFASILQSAHQDVELSGVMRRLSAMSLTPEQREQFGRINLDIVVAQAEAVRKRGDLAGAYDVLAPWLAVMPDEPKLQGMLGKLYTSAGEPAEALRCYKLALSKQPDDHGTQLNTIYAAINAKDFSYGEQVATQALHATPNDPDLLAAAGRLYRAEGRVSLAADYLRRSLMISTLPPGTMLDAKGVPLVWQSAFVGMNSTTLPATNPFAGKTAIDVPAAPSISASPPAQPFPTSQPTVPSYLPPTTAPYTAPATTYSVPYPAPSSSTNGVAAPYGAYDNGAAAPANTGGYATAYPNAAPQAQYPNGYAAAPAAAPVAAPAPYPYAAQAVPTQNNPYALQPQGYANPPSGYVSQADTPWPAAPTRYAAAEAPLPAAPVASAPARLISKVRKLAHNVVHHAPVYAQRSAPVATQQAVVQTYPQQTYASYPQQYVQQPYAGYQQQYVPQPPPAPAAPVYLSAVSTVSPAAQETASVAEELAQIDQAQSNSVEGGIIIRNRAGEDGLSNLSDIEAPIKGSIALGNGHISITATPVTLDAGTSTGDNFSYTAPASSSSTGTYTGNETSRARFGGGLTSLYPCDPVDACSYKYASFGSQTATGVGLQLDYQTGNVQAAVGVTPLGFQTTNVLGDLKYSNNITDKVSYSLAVTRQAVTDSLLSYAGAHDASTGLSWGGVVSNNVHGDLAWDDGTNGVYVNAQFMYLDGDHVERNYGIKGGGGVYSRVWKSDDYTFTVGLNTTLMGYSQNQSYFTYGQGGYFSPQQYVILNIPVELAGRDGAFTYDLKGSVGLQHYHEKAVPYFPLDPNLETIAAQWGATSSLTGGSLDANGIYPAQSSSGVSYSILGNAEYQLSPQLTVGAMASLGNAYEYREWLAAVYVRYNFTPQTTQPNFPPAGFNSPYLASN